KSAGRLFAAFGLLLILCSACLAQAKSKPAPASKAVFTENLLQNLCRALKSSNPSAAYAQLSVVAAQKSSGILGSRAALALGYFDYGKGNYTQAAKWLARAKDDPLLADYALYWTAETSLSLGHSLEALAELEQFHAEYPDSVITDQALQSLGEAAIASRRPADAVAALDASALTPQRPALLLLLAEAREQAGQPAEAAIDYQAVYTRFATSEQSREAG